MKTFALIVKYVIVPCSTVVGLIYGFDMYVIERAKTVAEPIRAEMISVHKEGMIHIDSRFDRTEKKLDRLEYLLERQK